MEEITPAQKKQLEAWATLRDQKLGEISRLDTEIAEKTKKSEELTASNTEVQTQINRAEGRLIEIEKKEKERVELVSHEILALEKQKTTLESEIPALKQVIVALLSKEESLRGTIETLTLVHDKVFDRTGGLEAIVDHVKNVSESNLKSIINTFEVLKETSNEIIAINRKNVSETMIVIEKLPRAILEYRRPIPPVRTVLSKHPELPVNQEKQ